MNDQNFGVGDVAMLGEYRVLVKECGQDEDGTWWYTVRPLDLQPPFNEVTREVPQDALAAI